MNKDPRGPNREIRKVEERADITLLTLDCGHVAQCVSHFHYKIGNQHRCYACGQTQHWENQERIATAILNGSWFGHEKRSL